MEQSAYKTLEKVFKKLDDIDNAKAVLNWDMAVMMPTGGAEARSDQLATLTAVSHAILTDDGIEDCMSSAKDENLDKWQRANLNCMVHDFKHAAAVPAGAGVARRDRGGTGGRGAPVPGAGGKPTSRLAAQERRVRGSRSTPLRRHPGDSRSGGLRRLEARLQHGFLERGIL